MDKDLFTSLLRYPPPNSDVVGRFLEENLPAAPSDYKEFLMTSDGADGVIGDEYFVYLFPINRMIESQAAYLIDEFAPGLFMFGSDGCGNFFAFDKRRSPYEFVRCPFDSIGFDDITDLGQTLEDFLRCLPTSYG